MSEIIRYDKNPFLETTYITTKKKRVIVGSSNHILVDNETGESSGTVIAGFREVDDEEFVKVFTQNIGMMFGFTAAGIKTFSFLIWAVQNFCIGRDLVQLDQYSHGDFMKENEGLAFSMPTLFRGLKELEKGKIIAKAQKKGFYYINPHFVFNGDRIRFFNEIRRKKPGDESRQEELFD